MKSAARPPSSRKPPNASVYALTTHWSELVEKSRSAWMEGRATFTTVASSTTMNCAMQTSTRTSQRRSCSVALGEGAVVTGGLLRRIGQRSGRRGPICSLCETDRQVHFRPETARRPLARLHPVPGASHSRPLRPLLFRARPGARPRAGDRLPRRSPRPVLGRLRRPPDGGGRLAQEVLGSRFPNPVGLAAGFDKRAGAVPGLAGARLRLLRGRHDHRPRAARQPAAARLPAARRPGAHQPAGLQQRRGRGRRARPRPLARARACSGARPSA